MVSPGDLVELLFERSRDPGLLCNEVVGLGWILVEIVEMVGLFEGLAPGLLPAAGAAGEDEFPWASPHRKEAGVVDDARPAGFGCSTAGFC